MESAIPSHLQCPRLRHRRVPDDYVPPYPATVARYRPEVTRVVMAYFGIQHRADAPAPALAARALHCIAEAFAATNGPGHWDRAQCVDAAGYLTTVSIGYWDDPAAYATWFAEHGARWASGAFNDPGLGLFTEVLQPAANRFETLFSSDGIEGVAGVSSGLGEPIQEHAYWGGMRDRLALSQTDGMAPEGAPQVVTEGLHQRVLPHENLCLIRSGQDWAGTQGDERRMYTEEVEPVLRAGMDFLQDQGRQVDCYANRYMAVVDTAGKPTDKSFGMGWWRSLAALERWAESHPTHVAIFGAAMKYLGTMGPAAQLKLYHEVTVARAEEQYFEYFNCHPRTGMLGAVAVA